MGLNHQALAYTLEGTKSRFDPTGAETKIFPENSTSMPFLLMPRLLMSPGFQHPSFDHVGFQLRASSQYWEIMENKDMFCMFPQINSVKQRLTHCSLVTSCVNIGSGNDLLPEGTKPSPEPILIHYWWRPVIFTCEQFCVKGKDYQSVK